MAENSIDRKKARDDLKIDRAKLFEQFLKHPKDTRLALAVKIIDDQIANCTESIRTKEKNAEKKRKNIEFQELIHEIDGN
jgi:CRISPR/Cas system-associated endonuclease Cas1